MRRAHQLSMRLSNQKIPVAMANKVITVFGGTGMLGRCVVGQAASIGAQVLCPFRGRSDPRSLRLLGDLGQVVPVKFDPRSVDQIRQLVSRSDMVFNCMGKWTPPAFSRPEELPYSLEAVHANIPRLIAEACAAFEVDHFVHVSHIGADPTSKSKLLASKGKGEEYVREAFPNTIIVRPTDLMGPQDRLFNTIGMCHRSCYPRVPVINRGQTRVQPVFVNDVAAAMVYATGRDDCAGKVFEFGGPQTVTITELYRWMDHWAGRGYNPLRTHVPYPIAYAAGFLWEFGWRPYFSRDWVQRAYMDNHTVTGQLPGFKELGLDHLVARAEDVAPDYMWIYSPFHPDSNLL